MVFLCVGESIFTSVVELALFLDSTWRVYSLDINSFNSLKEFVELPLLLLGIVFGHPEVRLLEGEWIIHAPEWWELRTLAA